MRIKCNHCGNEQEYNLRGATIPKRPKTKCSNSSCDKWIYINKDQLVRSMSNSKEELTIDLTKDQSLDQKDDQKTIITLPIEAQIEPTPEEPLTNQFDHKTNNDQKPKDQKTKKLNHKIPDFNELIQFCKEHYKNESGEVIDIEIEQFLKHTLPRLEHQREFGYERGGGGWSAAVKCTIVVMNKLSKLKKEGA